MRTRYALPPSISVTAPASTWPNSSPICGKSVSVLLPDKPGELCKVAGIVAKENGNVIKLEHNQFVSTNRSAAVELRITLEAFGTEHKHQIITALEKEGYSPKLIQPII